MRVRPIDPSAPIAVFTDPASFTSTASPVANAQSPCVTSASTRTEPFAAPLSIASAVTERGPVQPSRTSPTETLPSTLAPTSRSMTPRTYPESNVGASSAANAATTTNVMVDRPKKRQMLRFRCFISMTPTNSNPSIQTHQFKPINSRACDLDCSYFDHARNKPHPPHPPHHRCHLSPLRRIGDDSSSESVAENARRIPHNFPTTLCFDRGIHSLHARIVPLTTRTAPHINRSRPVGSA